MEMKEYMSQTGISIGDQHTFRDWGLLLISISISSPEAKTKVIDVLGGDGHIDMTEAFGPVRYKNRTLVFSFILLDRRPEIWHGISSRMKNYRKKKKMKVTLDSDPGYYWEGRLSVESVKEDQVYSSIEITLDAFPYKYERADSQEPWKWDSFSFVSGVIRYIGEVEITAEENKINIPKGNMRSVPKFFVSQNSPDFSVDYQGHRFRLKAGWNRFPQISVGGEEDVVLYFSGTGKVKVEYRGGSL